MAKKVTKSTKSKAKKVTKSDNQNIYSTFGVIILLILLCIVMGIGFFLIPKDTDYNIRDIFSKTVKDGILYTVEVNPKKVKAQEPQLPIVDQAELLENTETTEEDSKQTQIEEVELKKD